MLEENTYRDGEEGKRPNEAGHYTPVPLQARGGWVGEEEGGERATTVIANVSLPLH